MINKNSKYWKEALFDDKMRQERGLKPLSEIDLIATALYFERCNQEAMDALEQTKKK